MNKKIDKFKSLSALAMLIFMNAGWAKHKEKDFLDDIDLDREMELIKQKKSNLSVRERKIIQYRYEERMKEMNDGKLQ